MTADVSTPSLLVDLDVLDANLRAADALLDGTGMTLRPHVKTHRTPALARRQIGPHAPGVTCATVGEAEVMARAGIQDLLIANEVVSPDKLARVARLAAGGARVLVAVDDPQAGCALGAAAAAAGTVVEVLVDVDVGLGRCGVRDPEEAVAVAQACLDQPGLRVRGLMGYEGRLRAAGPDRAARSGEAFAALRSARAAMVAAGLPVDVISGGGTSTLLDALADGTLTEVQAGTYALMEDDLQGLALPFRAAVAVLATVISRRPGRAVVDAGRKTIGCEYGPPIVLRDGWSAVQVSEEHTVLATGSTAARLGEAVLLRPSQVRTTFNLHDDVLLHRGGTPVERTPVAARGRSS